MQNYLLQEQALQSFYQIFVLQNYTNLRTKYFTLQPLVENLISHFFKRLPGYFNSILNLIVLISRYAY